jgi:hypothetical protein
VQGGKCLVAWSRIQRPLELGGLGILDIERMGIALLRLRWLWFRRTYPNRPWSKLPFSVDKCALALFDASLQIVHGNGKDIIFWCDPWLQGRATDGLT